VGGCWGIFGGRGGGGWWVGVVRGGIFIENIIVGWV
jgi:hypothetical protein